MRWRIRPGRHCSAPPLAVQRGDPGQLARDQAAPRPHSRRAKPRAQQVADGILPKRMPMASTNRRDETLRDTRSGSPTAGHADGISHRRRRPSFSLTHACSLTHARCLPPPCHYYIQVKCSPNQHIINQGEIGDVLYVVESGCYEAFLRAKGEEPVQEYHQGELFGELALMYNSAHTRALPHTHTHIALNSVCVCVFATLTAWLACLCVCVCSGTIAHARPR